MKAPSFADSFEVLVLQAADEGRGPILFGDSVSRARAALRPFMVGPDFPSVYLEFPLVGNPFLDVTVLYSNLEKGTRIDSPMAAGTEEMLDWFAVECEGYENVCCGFELDVKARWTDGILQPSKLYYLASAGVLDNESGD